MIKRRAILVLNDLEYEILHCGYRFTRKIDAKGRPISGIRGGDLWVVLESGEDNRILSQMLLKSIPASKGYIALLAGEDNQCVRRIEFEKAYVYSHGEQMQADAARPMMTQVHITPLRLDVNANVRLDRRWPETSGFHWQKYEEPITKDKTTSESIEIAPEIVSIEIIDAKNNAISDDIVK